MQLCRSKINKTHTIEPNKKCKNIKSKNTHPTPHKHYNKINITKNLCTQLITLCTQFNFGMCHYCKYLLSNSY